MRSSAGTAVGVVAKLVHVHAALSRGIMARDVVGDGRWGGLGRLLKGDGAADLGVTAEDCDCVARRWLALAFAEEWGEREGKGESAGLGGIGNLGAGEMGRMKRRAD